MQRLSADLAGLFTTTFEKKAGDILVHRVFLFQTATPNTLRVYIRHKQFINSDTILSLKDLE